METEMSDFREQMQRARREAPPGDEAFSNLVDRHHRRRRNGRLFSAAVALAVTGAMVAGGFAVLNHRTTEGQPGHGSTNNLPSSDHGTAPASSNLVAGPGQFYYWKYSVVLHSGHADMTYWYSPTDEVGRVVSSSTTDEVSGPNDEHGNPLSRLQLGTFPLGDDLSYLSTDPAVLLQQLEERSAPDGRSPRPDVTPRPGQDSRTGSMVSAVEDLLSEMAPHASPQLRVALYEVLKSLPTAEDLGALDDPTGRPAVAVRITTDWSTKTFYFDPDTHLFLAEEERLADDLTPQGEADRYPTYLIVTAGGISDSDTASPDADHEFFPEAGPLPQP
jgi:hypothetical protein